MAGERLTVDELHGVVVHAAFAADGVDGHDVRVVQARRRLRLVVEALQLPRVHRRRERQHLQRHPPAQRHLLRLVDDAHAAPAHLAHDAKSPSGSDNTWPICPSACSLLSTPADSINRSDWSASRISAAASGYLAAYSSGVWSLPPLLTPEELVGHFADHGFHPHYRWCGC